MLCSNFVKFGRRVIGVIVRYLPDKISPASQTRYYANRAQNLPGPAPDNVLKALPVLSKSVCFRRSNSRTREHRQIAT